MSGWTPERVRDVSARLWRRDVTLWGDAPGRRRVAADRLGWLELPWKMEAEVPGIERFAREVAADGFTHAVLLGMGGSSLAPEVMRLTFGVRPGFLDLAVLDNTSPAAVRAVMGSHDPARTLVVVSSKSGATIEVDCFERTLFPWVAAARGGEAGAAFVAITDPGTPLATRARERGYRRTFVNPPDIGGRYSALSLFGLVPAALCGVDVGALLAHARAFGERARAGDDLTAAQLGATLGALARAGRDKLTFVAGRGAESLGAWLEQLIAESTGKEGRGIVPVDHEPLAPPAAYGDDRVFVALATDRSPVEPDPALQSLAAHAHPVLREPLNALDELGAAFLRWEIATAVAGAALDLDPFDEPNVAEAKHATREVLERAIARGGFQDPAPRFAGRSVRVFAPDSVAERVREGAERRGHPASWIAALLALARPGDYVALLAYLHRTPEIHERLTRLRVAARAATRCATTLGYGPRYLHSTGQLHKGGPNTGMFLQITGDEGGDVPIPDQSFGFAWLRRAQADGDYDVLARHDRRVMRVDLGPDLESALDEIVDTLTAARV
ncbi:MAG TPA: glucose-6-phosphate isomerase [Candidatus Eisenbacteria bacterium]|nr:glucose-6-phosphate isomerase [Candidatus Eisenbacteria bacterium]